MICFIGTLFLTNTISKGFAFQLGDTLTLLSALFYALQIVYFSNTAANVNPFVISFLLGIVQAIGSGLWSILFESQKYSQIEWQSAIWPVIILGIVASFGGQTLQVLGQKFTDATSSGLILMTESLFGSLFSVYLGFEPLTNNLLIGGTLITVSIILMQLNISAITLSIKNRRINLSKNIE
jgi:EamA-like transporter family.